MKSSYFQQRKRPVVLPNYIYIYIDFYSNVCFCLQTSSNNRGEKEAEKLLTCVVVELTTNCREPVLVLSTVQGSEPSELSKTIASLPAAISF